MPRTAPARAAEDADRVARFPVVPSAHIRIDQAVIDAMTLPRWPAEEIRDVVQP